MLCQKLLWTSKYIHLFNIWLFRRVIAWCIKHTGVLVYTLIRKQVATLLQSQMAGDFAEQRQLSRDLSLQANTPEKCQDILAIMDMPKKVSFKVGQLLPDLLANTPGPKADETYFNFMVRRTEKPQVQEDDWTHPSYRINDRKKRAAKNKRGKGKASAKASESAEEHMAKHGGVLPSTVGKAGGDPISGVTWGSPDDIPNEHLNEEFGEEEILEIFEDLGVDVENDILIAKELAREISKQLLVRSPGQLGHWIETEVDATRSKVRCNCEDYNFDRFCLHCATFESLQFGHHPDSTNQIHDEKWYDILTKCKKVLRKTYVDHAKSN